VIPALALVAGAVLGLLLPPAVYRLSVGFNEPPRTTCHHCGRILGRGLRCPDCGTRWGPPAWVTAAVAGVASGVLAVSVGPRPVLPLFVALAVVGTALGAIDLACRRLPTAIVGPAIIIGAVALLAIAALTGDWGAFGRALLGAAALGLLFGVLYLLPGRGLGYGDVRLAALLGLFLGWLGWPEVIWGAVLPWLVNGPVVLILLLTGRVTRKSRLPLGPAMLVGGVLAVVAGAVRI
jgi:leader peptidase (prepilin peptidase) / N-methyltransferase